MSVGSHVTDAAAFEFEDSGTHFHAGDFGVVEADGAEVEVVSLFFEVSDESSDDCPSEDGVSCAF